MKYCNYENLEIKCGRVAGMLVIDQERSRRLNMGYYSIEVTTSAAPLCSLPLILKTIQIYSNINRIYSPAQY